MDIQESKADLRKRAAARRSSLSAEERRAKEAAINERLLQMCVERYSALDSRAALMTYMPIGSEPDITPIMEWCWAQGVKVVLPRVTHGARTMALHEVASYDQLAAGSWGIREPLSSTPTLTDLTVIDVILVPGLAFDYQFRRLGYGGGYYDRLFAAILQLESSRPLLTVAAFDLQLVEEIPILPHDVRMDRILTETLDLISIETPGR